MDSAYLRWRPRLESVALEERIVTLRKGLKMAEESSPGEPIPALDALRQPESGVGGEVGRSLERCAHGAWRVQRTPSCEA